MRPSFDWNSLPSSIRIVTILVALGYAGYVLLVLRAWRGNGAKEGLSAEEKTLGVTALGGFITVGVASASILLTGTGVLLALEPGHHQLSTRVFTDLALATVWLVISLISGALAAAWIVNHANHKKSVAEHPLVMATASAQFLGLILGATYFVLAIFLL